jgi:hypothetical protein
MRCRIIPRLLVKFVPALLAACASASPAATPRVFFASPADGAIVSSPVHVTLGAESFTVEPAGAVKPGAGHLHIMVDAPCVAAGSVIPKDAQHLHYGQAQLAADLDLTPGQHTLCLQAADGAHTALGGVGLTQQIKLTVK